MLAGRLDTGKRELERDVVREAHDQLVHDLVASHRARDGHDLGVCRPFPDEIARVEAPHCRRADAARQGREMEQVGLSDHRPHRSVNILVHKFMLHMRVERGGELR